MKPKMPFSKPPDGEVTAKADITVLALGGGSWKRLGSDGKWMEILKSAGIRCNPFKPANCGFDVAWTDHLIDKCAGSPVKAVTLTVATKSGPQTVRGEFVISRTGIEGSAVYAISAALRDQWLETGDATVTLDLTALTATWPTSPRALPNHAAKTRLAITCAKRSVWTPPKPP